MSKTKTKKWDVAAEDRIRAEQKRHRKKQKDKKPVTQRLDPNRSKNPKQVRARIRRHQRLAAEELQLLEESRKPIEDWDDEELARGRPRDKHGKFSGGKPKWIDQETHEEIIRRLQGRVREGMQVHTVAALDTIGSLLTNDRLDDKGRPMVPASVKLEASKFLVEHVIGKPKQHQEVDITVRLQRVLANAMVTGSGSTVLELGEGIMDAEVVDDEEDDQDGDD